MSKLDAYLDAATRDNTRQSYLSAVRHYEVEWGGFLPATADSIARYLADHADTLAVNTLRLRLAALAQWHSEQGFPDPTKAPVVRKVLRGIRAVHPVQEKRARPLQLNELERVVCWLDAEIHEAAQRADRGTELRRTRDKALVLLGFWRGFRGDELTRLRVDQIDVVLGEGLTCYLPHTKGDRHYQGRTFRAPSLSRLCPVDAYIAWIAAAHLADGAVFRGIDRWGRISERGLHPDSLIALLRSILASAGIESADSYSGHSLRRGFANWATSNGWDLKTLMEYVGWKDVQSAMKYLDAADPFAKRRIEGALRVPKGTNLE